MTKMFPVIDLEATGANITRLRKSRGLTVRDLQNWFGFEEPQAIYKWQKGKSLPTVDNLYALGMLLDVPMEEILVTCKPKLNIVNNGQQEIPAAPIFFPGSCTYTQHGCRYYPYRYSQSINNIQSGKREYGRMGLKGKRIYAFACGRWWTVETVNVII